MWADPLPVFVCLMFKSATGTAPLFQIMVVRVFSFGAFRVGFEEPSTGLVTRSASDVIP